MIEYSLIDSLEMGKENEYKLNGTNLPIIPRNTLTFTGEEFSWGFTILEKENSPGAITLGSRRLQSREITFEFISTADYTVEQKNNLIYHLQTAKYLKDITNDRYVPIVPLSINPFYDAGSHKKSGDTHIFLRLLDPFWTSFSYVGEETDFLMSIAGEQIVSTQNEPLISVLSGEFTIPANRATEHTVYNAGYAAAPPIITLRANQRTNNIQIIVQETNEGIQVQNEFFGQPGDNHVMVIDCEQGKVTLNNIDQSIFIKAGTGFFSLPVGISTLLITATGELEATMKFRTRVYL